MAAAKTSTTTINPLLKTYSGRPAPFQFPNSQEKMYIGSEVSEHVFFSFFDILSNQQAVIESERRKRKESTITFFNCVCVLTNIYVLVLFLFCFQGGQLLTFISWSAL